MPVILLNGPPRSGKDTIGKMLKSDLPRPVLRKFADEIRWFMESCFNVYMDTVEKDEPHPALFGRTPREVAIAYSEKFCKPLFGVDYFGKESLHGLHSGEWYVFTDSGFSHEAAVIAERHPCLQVRLYREGKTFQGDSRSWWEHPKIGHIDFHNNFPDLASLAEAVKTDLAPEILRWASR